MEKVDKDKFRVAVGKSYDNFLFIKRWTSSLSNGIDCSSWDIVKLMKFSNKQFINIAVWYMIPIGALLLFLLQLIVISSKVLFYSRIEICNIKRVFINTNGLYIPICRKCIKDEDYILEFPLALTSQVNCKKIKLYNVLSYSDFILAAYLSFPQYFYLINKKGFAASIYFVKVFDLALLYIALLKFPNNTEICTSSQKDRWVTIIDIVPNHIKSIYQHGTNFIKGKPTSITSNFLKYDSIYDASYLNMPHKLLSVSNIYSFTEKEAYFMKKGEYGDYSATITYIGYNILFYDIDDNIIEPTALIIGNSSLFLQYEKVLVKYLNEQGYKVFLKPHPLTLFESYNDVISEKEVLYIQDRSYNPKVDIVFSYASTLANEYEAYGFKVIYYDDIFYNKELDVLMLDNVLRDNEQNKGMVSFKI